jgi:hypothetical protein
MTAQLWVVRAGKGARYIDEFVTNSYIAVGFTEFAPDDMSLTDEAALRARATDPRMRIFANQVGNFAFHISIGDWVIVPRMTSRHRDYLVAEVTSEYRHVVAAPVSGHHQRSVRWLGRFSREALSPDALNTMGAILTLFRPTAVEAELRSLLTDLSPIDELASEPNPRDARAPTVATAPRPAAPSVQPAGPQPAAPPTVVPPPAPTASIRAMAPAQLDVDVDALGRARIVCAHPALVMEQVPRHIDPGRGWGGVPGVYVLTGTDLVHGSVRTGVERTLTTTLIVRPWAYVGLSEDFLSRLGSHRQSKPEWRRALLVRSGGSQPFSSDDIKYLEQRVYEVLADTDEVQLSQSVPRGNLSARPRSPALLDACADTVLAVLRLTGTLI